jgi:hypothetical protein
MLEAQTLIDLALGAVLAIIGWLARQLWDAVKRLQEDIHKIEVDLPTNYVKREEFSESLKEIKDLCRQIFDKVDSLEKRKADK